MITREEAHGDINKVMEWRGKGGLKASPAAENSCVPNLDGRYILCFQ